MSLSLSDLRLTATMARLALPEDPAACDRLAAEMAQILDYAALLQQVDIEPDEAAAGAPTPPASPGLRPDVPTAHLSPDEALGNAPQGGRYEDYFAVPVVIEET